MFEKIIPVSHCLRMSFEITLDTNLKTLENRESDHNFVYYYSVIKQKIGQVKRQVDNLHCQVLQQYVGQLFYFSCHSSKSQQSRQRYHALSAGYKSSQKRQFVITITFLRFLRFPQMLAIWQKTLFPKIVCFLFFLILLIFRGKMTSQIWREKNKFDLMK